jgi:phosphoribosylpyrophosphate synthetase
MVTRGSIVCKLLASLMTRAGLSHIITVDLWQREIQGFFDCPVDNLRAQSFLLKYIQHSVSECWLKGAQKITNFAVSVGFDSF